MARFSSMLLLFLSTSALAEPREDAVVALAEGRDAQAMQLLAAGIAAGGADVPSLRCLLGQVELRTGRTQAALDTFSAVVADAPCAMRATWGRDEALLALGRADEAGALFAQVGEEALGPNRDARTVARLSDLADRVLARETPSVDQATEALTLALQLAVEDDTELKLARRLVDLLAEHRVYSGGEAALSALAAAVQRGGDPLDKRRLARLVGGDDGLELLAGLPADPETQTLRIELGRRRDLGWQVAQLDRLIAGFPDHHATREVRMTVGRSLALAGWRVEAARVLGPLAEGQGDDAAKATRALAELALRAGDEVGAIALLDGMLTRSPRSVEASWATVQRGAALERAAALAAGRGDATQALALYGRLEQGGDPDAAYAAALMARQLGDVAEATRRLEAIPARWPETSAARAAVWALFRMRARDDGDPDGAVAWLDERAEAGLVDAEGVRAELSAPLLAVESAGGDAVRPSVRVLARGYEQVELRLHRVDLEAWLRAAGTLESLPQLDLGVIEPDRRWSVPVPNAHPQRVSDLEVPIDLPGPGLYAVTVASNDREAQTLLLRSRAHVIAQRVGPKVAVAVFASGAPVSGARVLLQDGATVLEARTDATGLAQVEHRGGALIVLAEAPQGPALTTLAAVVDDEVDGVVIAGVDLDRAVYRPGDTLGFRVAVDRAEPTERRDWSFWLAGDAGFASLVRQDFEERADGVVVGELPISLASTGHRGVGSTMRTLTLMARRPDGAEIALGTARVADVLPQGRRLSVVVDGQQAVVRLREEDGRAAAGVHVAWTWRETGTEGEVVTDASGEARVAGPPAGVPWTLVAALPGTSLSARGWTPPVAAPPWMLVGERDRLRASEPPVVIAAGEGAAHLRVVRLVRAAEPPPLADPWGLEPRWTDALAGVVAWPAPDAWEPPTVRETVTEQTLSLSGPQRVELPPLADGRYVVELVPEDGGAAAAWSVEVASDGLRLLSSQQAGLGLPLTLAVEGEAALVVVRSNDDVSARVIGPGQPAVVPGSARWREQVGVVAIGASGARDEAHIPVQAAIDAIAIVDDSGPVWTVTAQVRDAGGAPARAQVAVRLVDLSLEPRVGRSNSLAEGPLRGGVSWSDAEGWGGALRHGAWSTPISAALLDEVAREEEARRAQSALSGHLMNNAVQAALGEDVPLSDGFGTLGVGGYGSGGGGLGMGEGRVGGRGSVGVGSSREERPLQGDRERLLWAVLDTDERGVVQVSAPCPPREGRYRVEVVAVARGWVARAETALAVESTRPAPSARGPSRSPVAALALEVDPAASFDAGRAAVAARGALAALPLLSGEERSAVLQYAIALVGALDVSPSAYRDVGEAAQALAAVAELGEHLTLPRGTLQSFDEAMNVEGATQADRVVLAWARARAGLPVDDASVARLLREPERLSAEESSQLARTLVLLGRRSEARPLVHGQGPQALLAERELASNERERRRLAQGPAVQALLSGAPPAVGDPGRPAWIAALPASPPALLSAAAPAPGDEVPACALRLPLAADGLVVRAPTTPPRAGAAGCGAVAHVAVGDAVRVEGDLARVALPAGLERLPDPDGGGFLLRATAPGSFALHGIERGKTALSLELQADAALLDPLKPTVALALAREALAGGRDVDVWLDVRPRLEDWPPDTRAEVAGVRFRWAAASGAPAVEVVTAFEDLRDEAPRGSLSFEEVLITAHAYQELRPERAMAVQRAAIGAAFMDEAGIASRLEHVLGPLASIQVLAEIAERYPPVPEVEHALFELPTRVLAIGAGGGLPPELRKVGVTQTDLRLMSAAWNREFVALYPDSDLAPFAGQRLVVDLLRLGAWDPASGWGERFGGRYPQTEFADNYAYLEGLARSGAGDSRRAAALLRKVARQRYLRADGREGPSEMKDDAELALARILEASGDRDGALRAYEQAEGSLGDASASLALLRREDMQLDELVLLEPGAPAILPVTVAGVDNLFLRAYRLDLRTLFLRDGGLAGAADVQVAGISPAWSGTRSVPNRPFPREHELRLPLSEPGAWLVQVSAGGQASSVLVVRSALELVASDAGGVRRVTVLRGGKPAVGVAVRALGPAGVVAAVTDQRGAAIVPAFAPTLAFDGAS